MATSEDLCQHVPPRPAAACALSLQQNTANPHLPRRPSDTHRQVWLSLPWDHCSFPLGPGAHKILCLPEVCFALSCESSEIRSHQPANNVYLLTNILQSFKLKLLFDLDKEEDCKLDAIQIILFLNFV